MQTKTPPPAKYSGALYGGFSRFWAMMGDIMAKRRPKKLAMPHAVPLMGAGNASGVQPYRTALNMLWKKYSIAFRPIFDASVLTVAKRKSEMPIKADENTMAHFRPTRGTPYMSAPMMTPGIPQT